MCPAQAQGCAFEHKEKAVASAEAAKAIPTGGPGGTKSWNSWWRRQQEFPYSFWNVGVAETLAILETGGFRAGPCIPLDMLRSSHEFGMYLLNVLGKTGKAILTAAAGSTPRLKLLRVSCDPLRVWSQLYVLGDALCARNQSNPEETNPVL